MAAPPPSASRALRHGPAWALALVVACALPPAHVWAYEVCLDIPLSDALVDASPEGMLDFGEDRGRDEGSNPFPLQRWLYRVRDHDQPDKVLAGWGPLSSSGCTEDFDRDGATSVDVLYWPWAYFSGNDSSVVAYDCTSMPDCTFSQLFVSDIDVSVGTQARATVEDPQTDVFRPWLSALWSASFAEQEFAPRQGLTSYVAVDSSSTIFTQTLTNRILGGQPTVILAGEGYRGKWNVAHEYGHVVSLWDPVPTLALADTDYSLNGSTHSFTSTEYQSAAAAEGVAHFFSAAVWTDVGTDTTINLPYGLIQSNPTSAMPQQIGQGSFCPACGPGTAVERDWASALLEFAQEAAVDVNYVIGMLAAAYPWTTPAAMTGDFWNDFDTAMSAYLTMSEKTIWDGAAADKGIDQ